MIAIAPTDRDWYRLLRDDETVSEVNFWTPTPWNLRRLAPGDRFYFLVKGETPRRIGGYGEFAAYENLTVGDAWNRFGRGNGVNNLAEFGARIEKYAGARSTSFIPSSNPEIGCIILRRPIFFDDADAFTPESYGLSFPNQVVKVKYFEVGEIPHRSSLPPESSPFVLVALSQTAVKSTPRKDRRGQQEFRELAIRAYGGTCCITGETCKEALEAAHIQSYISPESNHVQNALLLRSDLHKLFDNGLIAIDKQYRLRISPHVSSTAYRGLNGRAITLPTLASNRPSTDALTFHRNTVFRA